MYVKNEAAKQDISDDQIRSLIQTAESTAGVSLSEEEENRIIKIVKQIKDSDIDEEQLRSAKSGGFTNTYEQGSFTVTKKVKGNMADRDKVFNFRVTFTGIEHMTGKIKADGTDITLKTDGTYDFTLKHSDDVTFSNIPFGVTATVNELDESGNVIANTAGAKNDPYTVSYDNNQSVTIGSKTETDAGVKVNAEFATTIINTSTENVDTGVILDNAPYMLMLAVVAGGAMMLVIKKRREEE